LLPGSSGTVINQGTINGGSGGDISQSMNGPIPGVGGVGIEGTSNITITNSCSISGGLSGDGSTRASAIILSGGNNTLELQNGSSITGNVVTGGTNNTLILGGTTSPATAFNVSAIGSQYQGFDNFQKTNSSIWKLTGSTTALTPWIVKEGTLSINADNNLGRAYNATTAPTAILTLGDAGNSATLRFDASITLARPITIAGTEGIFDTNGFNPTLSSILSGGWSLTKNGLGTLTLTGLNTYSGGTTVNAGALQGNTDSLQGNITNNATVNFNQTEDGLYVGAMAGTGSLIKDGPGILALAGASDFSGGATLLDGIALLGHSTALGTGLITFNGGTLQLGDDSLGVSNNLNLAATGNSTIDLNNFSGTFSGNIGGGGGAATLNLINTGVDPRIIDFLGNNNYNGTTFIGSNVGFLAHCRENFDALTEIRKMPCFSHEN